MPFTLRTCAAICILPAIARAADTPIDPCDSATIAQVRHSIAELHRAQELCSCAPGRTVSAIYEGTVNVEAHLARPGMLHTIPIRVEFIFDASSNSLAIREISDPQSHPQTEATLVVGLRVATQSSDAASFKEQPASDAARLAADAARWLPPTALAAAIRAAPSCRPGLTIDAAGARSHPITFTDAAGRAVTLLLDDAHRLTRIERLFSHPRLGDTCEWTRFDAWETRDGLALPTKLSRFDVASSITIRYDLSLVSLKQRRAESHAFDLPPAHRADIPTWNQLASPLKQIEFVSLAPNLWSAELSAANARVLIIERDRDLVLIDAPDGDDVCSDLVAALHSKFPQKPLALATFGHHHPSPAGGLRAIAATGATIVAPRAVEPHIRWLLSRPTSLGPPAIAAPENPRLQLFDTETTIDAGANSVRLIDIGHRSAHTFCFVVFYFPAQGILFEDDLGYFPASAAFQITPRIAGLAAALAERKITPRRLVQGWPVRGAARETAWPRIAEKLSAASHSK